MPRTSTVMSSARLLVVRRAFLVLDARWTMAKKHSPTSSLFPHLVPSLFLFLFRVLCRSTDNFSRSGNPSAVFYHSCLLAFVMTREGKEEEVEEEEEEEKK